MSKSILNNVSSLSFDNVNMLFARMKNWISSEKNHKLILDFSLIEYIDSAGVAMLIELHNIAQKNYNKSLIFKVTPKIEEMLKFYEVETLLEVNNE